MKITVVIPTYNTGHRLYDLFDSIRAQTLGFENIEVIFVDDNSSDDLTLDILDKLNTFDNVSVVKLKENSGFPGRGRNIGLGMAQGEFVIFSDHDDTYNEDAFEKMYEEMVFNDSDMVVANFNQVNKGKINHFNSGIKERITIESFKDDLDIFQIPAAIWTRMFRKEFLTSNDIFFLEGMLCEDVYVATLANFKAKNIVYLPNTYAYNYSIRDSEGDRSTIHLRNRKYIEAILDGYFEICKWLDENYPEYGKNIFKKHLTSWIYTIVLSEISDEDRFELFKRAQIIFKKYYREDPYFKGKYNKLVKYILNGDFDQAVAESREIAKNQDNMNHRKGLFKRIKNKFSR
ncbi:MAG: glycosyltransferase family 2 protein [Methanobrevibacter sp.]|uniref:glycosyltransferase family 2 protein n=1 Tax=Methanobrevibacter sp. TaxID=66852 RepID=UPI0026E075F9|nr:glycosyltransferase family 2 protein [Methanobrevibacter sp.]MDO5848651.1 glycosyltransferase family 2 protein [Methanobrevibacter sp.]